MIANNSAWETMAEKILITALRKEKAGELLLKLFDGYSVTVDYMTGELIYAKFADSNIENLENAISEICEAKQVYDRLAFEICAELVKGKDFTGKYLNSKGQINGDAVSEFYREKGCRLRQGLDLFNKVVQSKWKELENLFEGLK
jgi:hypothetical protein